MLINLFLFLNKLFPNKKHPFNETKNGVLDLNYSDFEYSHTPGLLNMYSDLIDINEFKGKKILDIGCGAGGKSIYIAEKYGSTVTGIDLNTTFLKEANVKASEIGVLDKVEFLNMSALNTDFKDDEFDIIIMSDVIEHIPDTGTILFEANRILKKGGVLIFDFAPYYHYFGHHLWDTLRIPWLHLVTTESFRIKLYEKSVAKLADGKKRIDLRIGVNKEGERRFTYLNRITRKQFENHIKLISKYFNGNVKINYFMIKNLSFLSFIPILREIFIRHIVGIMKK